MLFKGLPMDILFCFGEHTVQVLRIRGCHSWLSTPGSLLAVIQDHEVQELNPTFHLQSISSIASS